MAAPLRAGRCLLLCVLYAFAGFGRATPFPGTIRGLTVVHEFDPLETSDVFYESAQDPSLIRRNLTSSDIEVLDAILADESGCSPESTPRMLNSSAGRIAYGDSAPNGVLDFAVYLDIYADDGMYSCGASLVDAQYLISAAHCIVDEFGRPNAKSIVAVIGQKDVRNPKSRSVYNVKSSKVPSFFAPGRTGNLRGDIALLELDRPAVGVEPVEIATKGTQMPAWLVTAGWGLTESNTRPSSVLKYAAVPYLTVSQVKQWSQITGAYFQMEDDKMAAGLGRDGGDSCQGDSGGPLIIPGSDDFSNAKTKKDILVGVVSYGLSSRCGGSPSNSIGFYTAISGYSAWAKAEIRRARGNNKRQLHA